MILDESLNSKKTINRFKTLEQDFNKKHNNKYNYDFFIYSGAKIKGTIICPKHGRFEQSPTNHLSDKGCNECAIELRAKKRIEKHREDFIQDAKEVHGNRYDYSKTIYNGYEKNCIIVCIIHGEFEQTPANHLKKKGCNTCGIESMARKQRKVYKDSFVKRASTVHNNFYDYSKFKYISNDDIGIIICPIHGEFPQKPVNHINRKQGCPDCGTESMVQKQSEEARRNFKSKASKLHNGIYDYSKFIYINSSTKSIIICSKCLREFE